MTAFITIPAMNNSCWLTMTFKFVFLLISAGFAFLPFLWAINSVWFYGEAFKKPAFDEQKEIKKCKSLVLADMRCKIALYTRPLSVTT